MSTGMSREEGIQTVYGGGRHVVLLGAGASIAATRRNPEKGGKQLPSMDNLVQVVGLEDIVSALPEHLQAANFEVLYGKLHTDNPHSEAITEINRRVHAYFSAMQLPDEPTIYDYLVLSLRPDDVIATFNWDPFLYQAWCRNRDVGPQCGICFLHGNVAIGYSSEDQESGPVGMYARTDGGYFTPTKLLYPVAQKNYTDDEFIKGQWETVEHLLADKQTKRITIFGYGAPVSDIEAVNLLNRAWGNPDDRSMEQVDIIDVVAEEELRKRWDGFIHSHHYATTSSYFDSVLGQYPRRTRESYFHHYLPKIINEAFMEANPVPHDFRTMKEMWAWFKPLVDAEKAAEGRQKSKSHNKTAAAPASKRKPKRKPKPKKTHSK